MTQTSPIFTSLLPWLFIPFLTALKLVSRPTSDFSKAPLSGLSPLLWESIALLIAVIVIGAGKLVSTMTSRRIVRSSIAVATYAMIPAATLGARYLADPAQPWERAFTRYPESLAITVIAAVFSIALIAPLVRNRETQQRLSDQQNRLLSLHAGASSKRKAAHADISKQVDTIVVPEVERVISFLKSAALSADRIDSMVAEIRQSVSQVIKPFSHRLIMETNSAPKSSLPLPPTSHTPFRWTNSVPIREMLLPAPTAFLAGFSLWAIIARDASLQNPVTFQLLASACAVTLALWAGLAIVRLGIPRKWKLPPGVVVIVLAPANVVLYELIFEALRRVPPDFLGYGAWGFVSDFPNSLLVAAIAGPGLAVGGAFRARRQEILDRTATYQRQIEHEVAALNTDIWHVRRKTGLMVHGSLQGALIATGLQLQKTGSNELQVSQLVARLESALDDIRSEEATEKIQVFLASLADAWAGVCGVTWHVEERASSVLSDHPATSSAVAEVAREGLNNAVSHGNAENVDVSVVLFPPYTIQVSITDDGSGVSAGNNIGLGSQLFNTITKSWKIERKRDKTQLLAAIATPPWS